MAEIGIVETARSTIVELFTRYELAGIDAKIQL